MATLSEITEYEEAINALSTVAYAQLKALLQSLDTPNPIEFRDALLRYYPELLRPFLTAASDVALVWYVALRQEAAIAVSFRPTPTEMPPSEQLDAGVRYSLTPLFSPEQSFLGDAILVTLAGFTQRMIADHGRDTIVGNSRNDRVRVGYQRVPRAGCCAFCGLMASRGAVYASKENAQRRGRNQTEDKYHSHCRCAVVPVFPGGDNDYLQYTEAHFKDLYSQTDGLKTNAAGHKVTDLKATLASWRVEHGTK